MKYFFIATSVALLLVAACTNSFVRQPGSPEDAAMMSSAITEIASEGVMMEEKADEPVIQEESMEEQERMPEGVMVSQAAETNGSYMEFSSDVIGNGERSVLFFHASWCPICKSADAKLMQWYASQDIPLTTYKIDYDSATDLRQRYGVTYQHTFISIDGQGNAVKKLLGPSDSELESLLKGSS